MNPTDPKRDPIATVTFADGVDRPVYDDGQGQYVLDAHGKPIYGVWFIPEGEADVPSVVGDVDELPF
jgi:hypothetical protein